MNSSYTYSKGFLVFVTIFVVQKNFYVSNFSLMSQATFKLLPKASIKHIKHTPFLEYKHVLEFSANSGDSCQ